MCSAVAPKPDLSPTARLEVTAAAFRLTLLSREPQRRRHVSEAMQRYFFDTVNGECVGDAEGEPFAGDKQARANALIVLGEILRFRGETFWETGTFSVIVKDENRREIERLTVTAQSRDGDDR